MPDNKQTPEMNNENNNKEPALSELISSAKENIEEKNKKTEAQGETVVEAVVEEIKVDSSKNWFENTLPEISFAKPKAAAETEKPKSEEPAEEKPKSEPAKSDKTEKPASEPVKSDRPKNESVKPDKPKVQQDVQKQTQKKKPPQTGAAAADKKKKPAAKPSGAAKKPANQKNGAKKPTAKGSASDKAKTAAAGKPKNAAAKKPKTAASKVQNGAKQTKGGKEKSGKVKFTKKQIATVVGLILALLLVLFLIVYLIFSHYFNMLDRTKEHIYNSGQMTYSDVDYSRDDTFDKASEDEKLKELSKQGKKISSKDVMNILLIGEDLRDTAEGGAGNTDVMMILSVNTKDKTVTMTSIMRDCYVYIPNWYSTRINAAYYNGGVDLTRETIETYMNIKIDRYVLVNFMTFIDIVDTLGGLDITVTDEEANGYPGADPKGENTRGMQNPLDEQNKYLGNKKGTDYIKKGGDLHLNGNQALAYARLRYVGNSDYERTERQRKVIKEMIKESRSLSLVEMDRLAKKILPQIETDITKAEAAQLLVDMLDYRNYKIQEYRVPADGTYTNEIISGMDVLLVDFTINSQNFMELVYGSVEVSEEGVETDQIIE
ncbi:MAG: LCP family protein [Oscillospiraceae bacterium]